MSNIFLTNNKFGLNILTVCVKFTQCQTVLRNALKTSPNESIKQLWKSTNKHTNIQYDVYISTKEVLKEFHSVQEDKLKHHLICQGSFFSNVAKFSFLQLNSLWSTAQSELPRNIFNFTVCYINSSLHTRKNLTRWSLSFSPDCSFYLCPETLLHVVAGCQSYLQRFTWRHDSILNFIAETLQTTYACHIYADLPGFRTPSIICGDAYRLDLLLITPDAELYIVQLTVGFESNLHNNVERKKAKYENLIKEIKNNFVSVRFVNLAVSCLGVFDKECCTFLEMLDTFGLDKNYQRYCIKKNNVLCHQSNLLYFLL